MPVRERGQGEPTPGQHVPFSGHVQAHTPGERRAFAPAATEDTGERDSPLEETGFELLVPPSSRTIPQILRRLVGFDGGSGYGGMSGRFGGLYSASLVQPARIKAIGIFGRHLDDAVLSDGDMPAGERLDRADPLWRLEADIDRLRRFQFSAISR